MSSGQEAMSIKKPYIIVLGNEKGGTGKSTATMHVMVYLLRLGFQVIISQISVILPILKANGVEGLTSAILVLSSLTNPMGMPTIYQRI